MRRRVGWFLLAAVFAFTAGCAHKAAKKAAQRQSGSVKGFDGSKRLPGWVRPTEYRIDLRLDGRAVRSRGHSVSLVNAAPVPFWGVPLGPEAPSDDGLLDVTVLRRRGPVGVALDAFDLLTGRAHETRAWQARRVTLDAAPALPVHADGELIGSTPVTVTVVPRAARLLVPASDASRATGATGAGDP